MSAVGSVLLVGLAMNLLGITKIKVLNFLPSIFMPILLVPLFALF
jgi:membrane protein